MWIGVGRQGRRKKDIEGSRERRVKLWGILHASKAQWGVRWGGKKE